MSEQLARQAIVTEIERAKTLWDAANPGTPLLIDYENKGVIPLADVRIYLVVDIVFLDGTQMDLNAVPMLRSDGQIMLAAGVKEGTGTQQAAKLRDFMAPFLQLRDNLGSGVRTSESKKYPPSPKQGFYYLPLITGFWVDEAKPAVP